MSAVSAAVMIGVNVAFVPRYGYIACAWGGFAGYGTAMLMSYFIGQKKYPIKYDMKSLLASFALALALYGTSKGLGRLMGLAPDSPLGLKTFCWMGINVILLGIYCLFIWKSLSLRPVGKK